jgi:hypothetical protein
LFWKWIWTSLLVPEKWKIDFWFSGSWEINTYYYSWSWIQNNNISFWNFYEIEKIKCLNLDESSIQSFTWWNIWTWTIEIGWNTMTLTWSCNNTIHKKLITTIKYKNNFTQDIEINTINWLIKKLK